MDIFDLTLNEKNGTLRDMTTDFKAPFISAQVSSGEYFYLNLTPPDHCQALVVCGGREQCASTYRMERNHFKYHSLEFVSAGCGRLILKGKEYPLRPGAVFYYGPDTEHIIETDPDRPLHKHFVDFVGTDLIQALQQSALSTGELLHVSKPFKIRTIFKNLLETGSVESRNRDAICVLLLRQLILQIDESAIDQKTAFSPAWQTYLRCRQHLERNFQDIATIHAAADACFVNQAYLSRLFKRFADESPLQLLTRLKMTRAAELLVQGDLLIKQVAEESGFPDPYHFSRVFKRVYGIPPETFVRTARRE